MLLCEKNIIKQKMYLIDTTKQLQIYKAKYEKAEQFIKKENKEKDFNIFIGNFNGNN
jgi:DNA polymerase sigma